jgi:glucose/arabinose dehydrogenase
VIRRAIAILAVAFVVLLGGMASADRASGHIPFPDAMLIHKHGGATFATWPHNDHRYAHPVGSHQVPVGFHDDLVADGFVAPTALSFLPDGSVLVTEQRGTVVHYRPGAATPADIVIDAREEVFNHHQLGLLGLGIDPDFPVEPYVYLSYTRDALPGGNAPRYGNGGDEDPCAGNGLCPASGRLVRYQVDPSSYMPVGGAQVLVDGWCEQSLNHSVGTIAFDPTSKALLAGGGDGADGSEPDWGQFGSPTNACGDPPGKAGLPVPPPTSEGGSLRSQDLRLGNDPVGLSGTIIRIDRRTGEGMADNPLADSADANARRILAYGLRNPYRFTFRPGSDEIWVADVGFEDYEELDLLSATPGDAPPNYGWPCYEGPDRQEAWSQLGTNACDSLYADESSVTFPVMSFPHDPRSNVRGCNARGSALSAITFYNGQSFPSAYHSAVFVSDLPRRCLFVIQPDANGVPDVRTTRIFARHFRAVDMVNGPDGALYYVDVYQGQLRRISYGG